MTIIPINPALMDTEPRTSISSQCAKRRAGGYGVGRSRHPDRWLRRWYDADGYILYEFARQNGRYKLHYCLQLGPDYCKHYYETHSKYFGITFQPTECVRAVDNSEDSEWSSFVRLGF
ncbi:MAG: hypothetical protein KGL39_05570 [Patescibacteria group bacterium]|nr:hypothetical protein [Patescibacteria group bacterium]